MTDPTSKPKSKAAPKAKAKPAGNAEAKPAGRAEPKPAGKAEAKPSAKGKPKPVAQAEPAAKLEPKPSAKAAPRRKPRVAKMPLAKYHVGQVVRHRHYPFRGIIFDVDPVFASTEEWWRSIPEEIRPKKNQPFYHLLAENAQTEYIAYVSEQNLLPDETGEPLRHPQVKELFVSQGRGRYRARFLQAH